MLQLFSRVSKVITELMDKATFQNRLIEATERVVDLAGEFVFTELPRNYRYLIYPNSSYDGSPIREDEERFPEDSKLGVVGPVDLSQAVDFLWRGGKIPQWINVFPHSTDQRFTYIELPCCGRFVGASRRLYHEKGGIPPFNCLSPAFPRDWRKGEKFDLNASKSTDF